MQARGIVRQVPDASCKETPWQTAGPYVHIGTTPNHAGIEGVYPDDLGSCMLEPDTAGERIIIEGQVFDGDGELIRDALVEIWQADAAGRYPTVHDTGSRAALSFRGWGRQPLSAEQGFYRFKTIRPGPVPYYPGRGMQAPHISFWIMARGINVGLHTRAYFADMATLNRDDPLLNRIGNDRRRSTLIAAKSERNGVAVFTFNIIVQGENETVFLDI